MNDLKDLKCLLSVFIICAGVTSATLILYQQIHDLDIRISDVFKGDSAELERYRSYLLLLMIIAVMAIFSFMTLFVQNRQYVSKSKHELSLLTEAINQIEDAVLIIDQNHAYYYTNLIAQEILGDQFIQELDLHYENILYEQIEIAQEQNITLRIEENFVFKTGKEKPFDISISPFIKNAQKMVIVTIRDISVRQESDREIQSLKHQFYQAQKMEALGRISGGIAHDFNNILAAIMGNAEFLMDDLGAQPKQHKYAEKIVKASLEARDVIGQILTYSRKQDVEISQFNLKTILDDIGSILDSVLQPNQSIKMRSIPQNYNILGNASQIKQVIINLCSNASDAIDHKKGAITIDTLPFDFNHPHYGFISRHIAHTHDDIIHIDSIESHHHRAIFGSIDPQAHYVDLVICDNGSGIERGVLEHIFEPFFTTKDIHSGTGLGLSAAQGVILNHKGIMMVDTIENEGTQFHILLPLDEVVSASQSKISTERHNTAHLFIVIDDHEAVLDVASTMLQRRGYKTQCFSDPEVALDFIIQNSDMIAAILSDENMPKMLGSDIAQKLQLINPSLPVFIMTGFVHNIANKSKDWTPNIKSVIPKPLTKQSLDDALAIISH